MSRTSFSNAEASGLAILGNIQLLLLAASLSGLRGWVTPVSVVSQHANLLAWSIPVLGLSILFFDRRWSLLDPIASRVWTGMLRATLAIGVAMCFLSTSFSWPQILSIVLGIIIASVAEFCEAVRRQRQALIWSGLATLGIAGIWLAYQGVIVFGAGLAQFGLLAVAAMATLLARRLSGHARFGVAARPMNTVSLALPGVIVVSTVAQEWMGLTMVESGYNSLALLAAAIIYFHHGLVTRRLGYHVAAGAIINVTLALLWNSMQLYDYQLYLVPLGLSIIGMVELLKKEIHPDAHDPIRYLGALTILVSPVFQIMNGSWWHLLSLMILSVMVVLIAIGLRVRVLVYAGSAFLAADMAAMVVRTTIDHPNLLWVGGLGVGVAVIVLAAICERHREQLLTRIRFLSKELATWN